MFNNFLIKFVILATFAVKFGMADKPRVEYNLANTILGSSVNIQNDPLRSAQCFAVYLPQLNNLTAVYEEEYNACLQQSDASKANIKNEVQAAANQVNATATDICGGFSACVFDSDPYGYFECSNNAVSIDIGTSENIQARQIIVMVPKKEFIFCRPSSVLTNFIPIENLITG